MKEQTQVEESPIVEFRPNAETNMELVNELKNVVKAYHSILRVSVQSKEGSTKLVKYPARVDENDIPVLNITPRNILIIRLTEDGIFNGYENKEKLQLENIHRLVLDCILSDGSNPELPEKTIYEIPNIGTFTSARKFVVNLRPSSKVTFRNYQNLKWEILSGFEQARQIKSYEVYKKDYRKLTGTERQVINEVVPIVLTELTW